MARKSRSVDSRCDALAADRADLCPPMPRVSDHRRHPKNRGDVGTGRSRVGHAGTPPVAGSPKQRSQAGQG
jgi:hypothetical protein